MGSGWFPPWAGGLDSFGRRFSSRGAGEARQELFGEERVFLAESDATRWWWWGDLGKEQQLDP